MAPSCFAKAPRAGLAAVADIAAVAARVEKRM